MKVTFANFGNYTLAFQKVLERLGVEYILPEETNQEAVIKGAKLSPELFCLPLKVNIGNYLSALEKGADTILMWENVKGICRLRYYWLVQEKILKEAGYNIKVINLNFLNFFSRIKELSKNSISFWQFLKLSLYFFKELAFIDCLEKKACYFRPREKNKGETEKIFREALEKFKKVKGIKELNHLRKETWQKFSQLETIPNQKVFKVGLIGEIYTLCDEKVNFQLEKKLGEMGMEVHRELNLRKHFLDNLFWREKALQRKVNPYLKSTVGGHGRQAIAEMLDFVKKGFDGVIQLLPFGCFVKNTNITVEDYLQKPIQHVKVGEKVLTHKGRFKRVTKTFCRDYKGKILKIDCGGKLLTIKVTPEHPVLLAKSFVKNHKRIIQELKFTPVIEAKKGDFIAIPIPKTIQNKDFLKWEKEYVRKPKWEDIKKFPYSPELLRMLGYWLAEGYISTDGSRCNSEKKYKRGLLFCFSSGEKDYIQDVIKIIKKNFKTRISQYYYPEKRPNSLSLAIGNRNLADIVYYLCSSSCDKKVIHNDLTQLEPNLQKEILKGFFRGDGNFTDEYGETTYRGVTTSWDLASQLFWFLIRNRIKSSFLEQHIENRKPSYVLKIANTQGIKRLGDERIEVTDRKDNVRFRELEDYFLVSIRKIETLNFKGKVYNLEVKDDHSYLANFLTVHNCMPEVTVRPILQKISQEKKIPFLSISLDEQVAETGIQTRLEAFVDLMKSRHQ